MALALIQVRSCSSVFPLATGDAKGLLYMAMTSFDDPCSESTGKCCHFNSQAGSIGDSALSYPQILRRTPYDLLVYGCTSVGVMTAVSGARQALKTVLIEPGQHVGGMATDGLSRTDVGKREVLGGLALEFCYRVGERYQMRRFNNPVAWFYEPRVGESVLREMLAEAGVAVHYGHRLREKSGVVKSGGVITEITTENGTRFRGKVFADASYEGDLMAQAKVSYTYGREASEQYGESLGGVRDKTPKHQFLVDVSAVGADGKPLPEVHNGPAGQPWGSG